MKCYIFGAKSIAISVSRAMRALNQDMEPEAFMVSSLENNPCRIDGIPVCEIHIAANGLTEQEKSEVRVYIATPEDVHESIIGLLLQHGFTNYIPVSACMEAEWMEQYYKLAGRFPSIHELLPGSRMPELSVYATRFYRDKHLKNPPHFPDYVHSILLGCSGNPLRELENEVDFCDNTGENISIKNPNYCEMTGYYWVWKNALNKREDYVGIYHYRRALDLSEYDLKRIIANDVDVVLPYPLIHLPDIREHHTRYVREEDWQVMLSALRELYPDYAKAYSEIFHDIYFYNYNLMIAKTDVFAAYCEWVFPILKRVEELSIPKGWERGDRYTAYMSENLLTLYFLFHKDLKIYHTGRILYT